jgi:hypothetical protein
VGEAAGAKPEAGWGGALGLTLAVLSLSGFIAFPLVVLPLAILLLGLWAEARPKQVALGALLAVIVLALPSGPLVDLSRGWALGVGGGFLLMTLVRPHSGVFARALGTAAGAVLVGMAALGVSGGLGDFDASMRQHFTAASAVIAEAFGPRVDDANAATAVRAAITQVGELQWLLFPGLLAIQTVAALALAAWFAGRIGGDGRMRLRPLREFRFDDHLVWGLIVGLALAVAPLGESAARVGYNLLFVMAALYAVRGLGVFLFLVKSRPPAVVLVFAGIAAFFLYFILVPATVLVGLADTWLDVRGRAAPAPRA